MDIDPKYLLIETYRAPGQTSGWFAKPDQGVQITHLPTGLQALCHESTNVHRNKVRALAELTAMVIRNLTRQLQHAEAQAKLSISPRLMSEGQVKQLITRFFAMTRITRRPTHGGETPTAALRLLINEVYAQGYHEGLRDSGLHEAGAKQPG